MVEDGSDEASELWNSPHAAASSLLFRPEGWAALAAARQSGRLSGHGYERSLADFEQLRMELAVIGIDEPLAERAGELAADLGLRGYDAVHLASALELDADDTVLVTWDRDLSDAAVRSGLAVAPGA